MNSILKKVGLPVLGLLQGTFGSYLVLLGFAFAFPDSAPGSKDYDDYSYCTTSQKQDTTTAILDSLVYWIDWLHSVFIYHLLKYTSPRQGEPLSLPLFLFKLIFLSFGSLFILNVAVKGLLALPLFLYLPGKPVRFFLSGVVLG